MTRFISKQLEYVCNGFDWVIQEMDVTQWGIVAVIFVVMGFMALRTRF